MEAVKNAMGLGHKKEEEAITDTATGTESGSHHQLGQHQAHEGQTTDVTTSTTEHTPAYDATTSDTQGTQGTSAMDTTASDAQSTFTGTTTGTESGSHNTLGQHQAHEEQTTDATTSTTEHTPAHHATTSDTQGTLGTSAIDTTASDAQSTSTGTTAVDTSSKPVNTDTSSHSHGLGHHGHGADDKQEAEAAAAVDKVDKEAEKGPDPALVGEPNPTAKLTGTGAPGSHSAYFGLTPDGSKIKETSSKTTAPVAAHTKDSAMGGGKENPDTETGSRSTEGNSEVADQMQKVDTDNANTAQQRNDPAPLKGEDDEKPGAGGHGLTQGTGNV